MEALVGVQVVMLVDVVIAVLNCVGIPNLEEIVPRLLLDFGLCFKFRLEERFRRF